MFDHPSFRWASQLALLVAALGALYLLAENRWSDAAALGAVALLGSIFIAARDRLPSLFTLLFVIAGLVNALGYVLTLWHEATPFDEIVHAFTSFTLCAAAGWLLLSRTKLLSGNQNARLILAVAAIGLVLGLLWEAFEWMIGIIGSPRDTIMDLVMDMVGAIAAGLFCAWAAGNSRHFGAKPVRL